SLRSECETIRFSGSLGAVFDFLEAIASSASNALKRIEEGKQRNKVMIVLLVVIVEAMKGLEQEEGATVAPPQSPNPEVEHPPATQDRECIKGGDASGINGYATDVPVLNGVASDHTKDEPASSSIVPDAAAPSASEELWDAGGESKEVLLSKLQDELKKARAEVRLRDEEVTRLSRVREEVEAELEELTASLFQEAHNMVREANEREAASERALKECRMQADVLTAEVAALKALVLTSTPSRPNPHLHPQISGATPREDGTSFNRKHRRSPSHFNLKYGRESSPPESPCKEQQAQLQQAPSSVAVLEAANVPGREDWEVDPILQQEFMIWRTNPSLDSSDRFLERVFQEDIKPSLTFANEELGEKVMAAVKDGQVFIEAIPDKSKILFPRCSQGVFLQLHEKYGRALMWNTQAQFGARKCALLGVSRTCNYRMKLGDQEQWHCISQLCRNRIIAVCDFLNYLRYIERGLVKSSAHETFWEVTRLRKEMVLARLGLPPSVQSTT
ncbi:hypothetical protein J437_LFUL002250, partial [Ladona fulva]